MKKLGEYVRGMKEWIYPSMSEEDYEKLLKLRAEKEQREASSKRFKKAPELKRLEGEKAGITRLRFLRGGGASLVALFTGIGVKGCIDKNTRVEEIYEWKKKYEADTKPYEGPEGEENKAIKQELIALMKTKMRALELGQKGGISHQEAQIREQKFRNDTTTEIVKVFQKYPNFETDATNLYEVFLQLGLTFIMYDRQRPDGHFEIIASLDEITEEGTLPITHEVAGKSITVAPRFCRAELLEKTGDANFGGQHLHNTIISYRYNTVMAGFDISDDDEESSTIANEVGHVLFAEAFRETDTTTWEFYDSKLGKLDYNAMSEIYSSYHQIDCVPIHQIPAVFFSIQTNRGTKDGYMKTYEILSRSMRRTGFFKYIAKIQRTEDIRFNDSTWVDIRSRMENGDAEVIEFMKAIRSAFIEDCDQILTGPPTPREVPKPKENGGQASLEKAFPRPDSPDHLRWESHALVA